MTPPWERGKDGKLIQNDLGHLLIVIVVYQGAGAFGRDFTTNLAPQCRAFSRALKNLKVKKKRYSPALMGWGIQMTGA